MDCKTNYISLLIFLFYLNSFSLQISINFVSLHLLIFPLNFTCWKEEKEIVFCISFYNILSFRILWLISDSRLYCNVFAWFSWVWYKTLWIWSIRSLKGISCRWLPFPSSIVSVFFFFFLSSLNKRVCVRTTSVNDHKSEK